ncbi:unnamed protein product [Linum trigynum]|uniref:PsbP C-terminal domain-containing protein n=1 Tax=Linum trigynum TaxID=586398 RepID=A0AAV2GAE0_9ROSI
MAVLLSLSSSSRLPNLPENPQLHHNTNPKTLNPTSFLDNRHVQSKRQFLLKTTSLGLIALTSQTPLPNSFAVPSPTPKPASFSGIVNTKAWLQHYGDGFSIRVPPQFEDIEEPEDLNGGLSLYGDKVKPKTFAARFATADGSEVVSVLIRPTNQLKITFLEAKDVSDLGSLKEAAKIFVPAGSTIYTARTIKIKEEEGLRTYYFYEFGRYDQHVALVAAVNSGKAIIAGAAAPQWKWDDVGVKLRSAAISLTVL